MPAASAPARCDSGCAGCCMGACISGRPCLPESGVSRRLVSPECPASPGKLRSSGHPGCSEGSVRPGCPERGLYPVASVRLRPALVSWLSPCPGFFRIPVFPASRFPRFTVSLSGGRRRIPGCRIGGCIVLFRFISMRNPKKRRNCGIRASIRPEIGAESPRLCRFRPSRIYITFCTVYL